MNIVYLDLDDIKNPLLGAGQGHATYFVGKELVKNGHSVTVFCSKYPGWVDREEDGIRYRHIGFSTPYIKLNNLLFFLFAPLAVLSLKTNEVDVIIECFTAPFSTLFSPLWTKIPVVALPSMFNADAFSRKYHLPFYLIERFGVRLYKFGLPYSEVDNAKFHRLHSQIVTQITPQGVSQEYFNIRPKEGRHILFLSRFDVEQKGIDLLLQAYKLIMSDVHQPLVLAGHGPDLGKIIKMIDDLGLKESVKIVGPAYGEKKIKLMEEASIVVFPSRHDEMCLWSLEVLAAGIPTVGFDITESKWIPGNTMMKALPYDTLDFAKKIMLAMDSAENKKMRQASKKFAKLFSWESVANQFVRFFQDKVLMTTV